MDEKKLTTEQKIVKYLAIMGYLTSTGDISKAMNDPEYANILITGNGLNDEILENGGMVVECDHESLTNEEIQEVFDNDYMKNSSSKNK